MAAALLVIAAAMGLVPSSAPDLPDPQMRDPERGGGPLVPPPPAPGLGAVDAAAAAVDRDEDEPRRPEATAPTTTTQPPAPNRPPQAEDPPTTTPQPAPPSSPEPKVQAATPAAECPATLAGVQPHAARAGHHIAQRFGVPQSKILGRGPRGSATSDHPRGLALDFMVDPVTGTAIAAYVLAHRDELAVSYVIWRQRYNDGTGWTLMPDRGTPTANHMDHVHISFQDEPSPGLRC